MRIVITEWAIIALVAFVAIVLVVAPAHPHVIQGKKSELYLWGHQIGSGPQRRPPPNANSWETGSEINCCKHIAGGDCHEIHPDRVKIVAGGIEADGLFVAMDQISISPVDPDGESRIWGCKDPKGPWHCFFMPANGV